MSFQGIDLTQPDAVRDKVLRRKIEGLREGSAYRAPLSSPHCGDWTPAGLVTIRFRYPDGDVKNVKLHAKPMVLYLRVLQDGGQFCEVTVDFTSVYSGSYRSYAQQNTLYQAYRNGTGHLAANPCKGYHRCGRAIDLVNGIVPKVAQLMTAKSEAGKKFFHGSAFGDPPHFSYGVLG
ncbi:MAG: hypothetical protein ACRDIC_06095 [bacterium]